MWLMTQHLKTTAKVENKIIVEGLRVYAFHGVMEQERNVGAYFIVDAEVTTDFSVAMETDELCGTISYADIFETIKREMAIPSKLIEHVGGRIVRAIIDRFSNVAAVKLRILKENPPMGADCRGAGIEITLKN